MTDWQPISSAPRDGAQIIVWDKKWRTYSIAEWVHPRDQWCAVVDGRVAIERDGPVIIEPEYWMPLPSPPNQGEG